jgi:hypothetical protein
MSGAEGIKKLRKMMGNPAAEDEESLSKRIEDAPAETLLVEKMGMDAIKAQKARSTSKSKGWGGNYLVRHLEQMLKRAEDELKNRAGRLLIFGRGTLYVEWSSYIVLFSLQYRSLTFQIVIQLYKKRTYNSSQHFLPFWFFKVFYQGFLQKTGENNGNPAEFIDDKGQEF